MKQLKRYLGLLWILIGPVIIGVLVKSAVTNISSGGTGDINITADLPAGASNGINIYVTGEIPALFDGTILNTVTAQPAESGASSSSS
ncbi:MAG: hypothetical protein EOO38_16610, partial [Cytophagaceae bacterium]